MLDDDARNHCHTSCHNRYVEMVRDDVVAIPLHVLPYAVVTPCCTLHCHIRDSFEPLGHGQIPMQFVYRSGHTLLYNAIPQPP